MKFKVSRTTREVQGVKFEYGGISFSGSKVNREFSGVGSSLSIQKINGNGTERFFIGFRPLCLREVRLQKQHSRFTDNERLLHGCKHQARKTLHSLLGVQQRRGRFSRLVHHPCALQLRQEAGTGIAGTCAVLQGVCATIWLQIPLHRRRRL